ncbi:peptidoglycan DD-metalloendopeptidase family protein [Herminiimonas sp. CN]|uniref:peptidoglycan DD-metalloendopeptidase family protein n=1 Tax=Herminiimonas sp. CN TaxID=1349818 RepID=UPI000473E1B9|nr:peptidoglycan DD-metalloendopeptidase family protein [Herminiimonas sp. CN]
MNKIRLSLLAALLGLLTACSTPRHSAPVADRLPMAKASVESAKAQAPAGPGYYTVKKGDTLYRIALDQGQAYRDIVAWNHLTNPNDIKVDQVLRVQPPDAVAGGAQTGSVASSAVEVHALSAPAAASGSAGNNKTAPRGDKRPYSESALAELQKPEAAAAIAAAKVPASSTAAASVKADPAKIADTDDGGIGWIWPAEGKVIASFDEGKNKGIDISGKLGQRVLAAGAGKVMYAGSGIRGYGNLVIVKHTNNLLSAYAHNKTINVKEGQSVSKGQVIAEMGNTDADAVKLHFEIRQQGKPVDPSKFLPSR